MDERTNCEWCGEKIPPRTDPRGRKARFCSDACRAAATRKRRDDEHKAELQQAREQTTLLLRTPEEQAREAAEVVRTMAHDLRAGRKVPATPQHQELVAAAKDFADLLNAHPANS